MEAFLLSVEQIVKKIQYLNIASITEEGLPWNTPVFYSFDKELNFYYLSWKQSVHSKNIEINPNVFITIYDSTVPVGEGSGVYIQGKAYELNDIGGITTGLKCHYDRSKHKMKDIIMFLTSYPRRVYKFVPEKIFFNGQRDIEGNYIDSRTEIDKEALKRLFQNL